MNQINSDITRPLNSKFSCCLSKYGTRRVAFSCTTKGYYVWFYTDDVLMNNIEGYASCKGTRTDKYKRTRTEEEILLLEKKSHDRYSFYLINEEQLTNFVKIIEDKLLDNEYYDIFMKILEQ